MTVSSRARGVAVAERARRGARALGPDLEAVAVEAAQRAAARRDGVHREHGREDPHPGGLGLVDALELGGAALARVDPRHVGRGAAHVEADRAPLTELGGDVRVRDDAARGPGQDRVRPAEAVGVGEPAARLHDAERAAGQLAAQLRDVVAEQRRQVGVDAGGVAAREEADLGGDLVREGDVREADLAGERADLALELAAAVGVQHHHREAVEAALRASAPARRAGARDRAARAPGRARSARASTSSTSR